MWFFFVNVLSVLWIFIFSWCHTSGIVRDCQENSNKIICNKARHFLAQLQWRNNLPHQQLKHAVSTRWNVTYFMLQCALEQISRHDYCLVCGFVQSEEQQFERVPWRKTSGPFGPSLAQPTWRCPPTYPSFHNHQLHISDIYLGNLLNLRDIGSV